MLSAPIGPVPFRVQGQARHAEPRQVAGGVQFQGEVRVAHAARGGQREVGGVGPADQVRNQGLQQRARRIEVHRGDQVDRRRVPAGRTPHLQTRRSQVDGIEDHGRERRMGRIDHRPRHHAAVGHPVRATDPAIQFDPHRPCLQQVAGARGPQPQRHRQGIGEGQAVAHHGTAGIQAQA